MAKKFAIMLGDKLQTSGMQGSISHVTRSQDTPNADPERKDSNYSVVGPDWNDASAIRAAVESRTPDKYRKDAVRLLEFVVTASPDWFKENPDDQHRYFESAVQFFQNEYGSENVVSGVVHLDETSPHLHLYVVPVDPETGRLNAKKLFGGRGDMSRRQTAFASHMREFGVERGQHNPARKHTKVRDWYQGHADLDKRQSAIDAQQQQVNEEQLKLQDQQQNLLAEMAEISKRENAVFQREKRLEQELQQARADLQQRSEALSQAAQRFEEQQRQWIAANRPPDVPPTVHYLRELLELGRIDRAERLDELDAAGVYLYDHCDADGLTDQGQELLQQHSGAIEQQQRFDEIFTQQPGPSGPSL